MYVPRNRELVVVKFGSDLVADEHGPNTHAIEGYTRGLAKQLKRHDLIVVTSGAVATGRARLAEFERDPGEFSLPVLAELGSSGIMHAWQEGFGKQGVLAGSVLVTHHEIGEALEGGKLKETLIQSLENGVVPIINANDTLSDEEIMELLKCSDNDGLASRLAHHMGAEGLRLFTRRGGLHNQYDQHSPVVNGSNIDSIQSMLRIRGESHKPGNGRGGMQSKVNAAYEFVANGGLDGRWAEIAKPNDDMLGGLVTRVLS
jgi:glutamate 5-kinase